MIRKQPTLTPTPAPIATATRRPHTPIAPPDTMFAFIETAINAGSASAALKLQSDQKQPEPDDDEKKTHRNLFLIRHRPADDQPLEGKQKYRYREYVDRAVGNKLYAGDDQLHCTIIS